MFGAGIVIDQWYLLEVQGYQGTEHNRSIHDVPHITEERTWMEHQPKIQDLQRKKGHLLPHLLFRGACLVFTLPIFRELLPAGLNIFWTLDLTN